MTTNIDEKDLKPVSFGARYLENPSMLETYLEEVRLRVPLTDLFEIKNSLSRD